MRAYLLLILFASMPAFAECTAQSGAITVPLLELYTSEGCSSCPPADEWLSKLQGTKHVVRLAFHVDYWDYIGWKDRFAKAAFTARQKQAAALNGASFVYTPQMLLNGRDFRKWRSDSDLNRLIAGISRPTDIKLAMKMTGPPGSQIQLQASAQVPESTSVDIYLAIYENNLKSRINAGENNGRELHHDYVVRQLFGPYRFQQANHWQRTIPLTDDWQTRDAGVAMFVQNRNSGEVLQALSLKSCG
ncbi:MAG TPA: DUF1223 domain-containing protein [Methylophilaceae bacterium]|nr:DUF1223 domain-containing protein [Methylophilaceae bacterium]